MTKCRLLHPEYPMCMIWQKKCRPRKRGGCQKIHGRVWRDTFLYFFCPVSNYSFPDAAATEKKFRNILPGSRFPCCRGGKNILSNAKSRKEEEEEEGHDEKQIIPPPLPPPPLTNSRKKEGTKIRVDLFPLRHRFLLLSTHPPPPPPPPLSQLFEQRRRKCPKDIYSLEIASNVQAKEDMWIEEAASFFQIEFSSV